MISLLIPVFNYNIVDLVTALHKQIQLNDIPFEIICLDDGSNEAIVELNSGIAKFENVTYKIAKKNNGRTKTRQHLALAAKYDWLLFLDADVLPKSENFIGNYLKYLNQTYDAIFGGFAYSNKVPKKEYKLRWTYGLAQEQKLASYRNIRPFKIIISANFLIKRDLFLKINSKVEENIYGLDNIFGAQLKSANAKVLHIDNEVYHLGIETNSIYLKKKENSALTVLNYYKTNKLKDHQNDLLHFFIKIKRFRLNYIFAFVYKFFGNGMRKNLRGGQPSIKLLQLYRISFMCYQDLQLK